MKWIIENEGKKTVAFEEKKRFAEMPLRAGQSTLALQCPLAVSRIERILPGSSTYNPAAQDWRRGRDSNPRYPFGHAGFQDRSHQPLGHLSGSKQHC